jgi:hypothetical protein
MADRLANSPSHATLQRELQAIDQPDDATPVPALSRGRHQAEGEVLSLFYTSRWSAARLRSHFDTVLRRGGWLPALADRDPRAVTVSLSLTTASTYCKPGYQARFTPAGPSAAGTWRYAISLATLPPGRACP